MDFKFIIVASFLLIAICLVQNCSAIQGAIGYLANRHSREDPQVPNGNYGSTYQEDDVGQSSTQNYVPGAQKLPIDETKSDYLCVNELYKYSPSMEQGCIDWCNHMHKEQSLSTVSGECRISRGLAHCACTFKIHQCLWKKETHEYYAPTGENVTKDFKKSNSVALSTIHNNGSPTTPILNTTEEGLPLCVDGNYQYNKESKERCESKCQRERGDGGACYVTKGYAHCRCWYNSALSSYEKDYELYSDNGNYIGRAEMSFGEFKGKLVDDSKKLSFYASDSLVNVPILLPRKQSTPQNAVAAQNSSTAERDESPRTVQILQ